LNSYPHEKKSSISLISIQRNQANTERIEACRDVFEARFDYMPISTGLERWPFVTHEITTEESSGLGKLPVLHILLDFRSGKALG